MRFVAKAMVVVLLAATGCKDEAKIEASKVEFDKERSELMARLKKKRKSRRAARPPRRPVRPGSRTAASPTTRPACAIPSDLRRSDAAETPPKSSTSASWMTGTSATPGP
jgi:hypothetical protein